ncbi:YhcN/YlaJ family sporulation lipoprotein [Pseudalkalibacillus caeni]|nr:YhcN/YlaJ family sporulation lipoprotein [Pseudalkalibacillus caeni]
MKKTPVLLGMSMFLGLAGCWQGDNADHPMDHTDMHPINSEPNEYGINNNDALEKELHGDFGYVRSVRNTNNDNTPVPKMDVAYLNRDRMADMISKLSLMNPHVNDSAVLVTDEEVLIGYKHNSDNRNETADQVKKSALSVVPRYYHVYVSDENDIIPQIERYSKASTVQDGIDEQINALIKTMKKSPQGRKISNGENENGEMKGDEKWYNGETMNDEMKGSKDKMDQEINESRKGTPKDENDIRD